MRVVHSMNIKQAEFERLLPAAVAFVPVNVSDGVYSGKASGGEWRIRLGPERTHRIGLIRLPLRDVEIVLEGYSGADAAAFRRRFDLYFQKGGG